MKPFCALLFKNWTPEIDETFDVLVHKEPPTPTPPVTVKAPVVVDIEAENTIGVVDGQHELKALMKLGVSIVFKYIKVNFKG